MKAIVELMGGLHALERSGRRTIEVTSDGTRVGALLEAAGIPRGSAGIIVVGGKMVEVDYEIRDGDLIQVYPPLDGG